MQPYTQEANGFTNEQAMAIGSLGDHKRLFDRESEEKSRARDEYHAKMQAARKERDLELARVFGNRRTRRHRFDGAPGSYEGMTAEQKKKRNKRNRAAKKSRKMNRSK